MLRNLLLGVLALACVMTAGVLSLPVLLPSDTVREQVAEQLSDLTGRSVSLRGEQVLQVFPRLSVTLEEVVLAGDQPGADNALLSAEELRGSVRLLPLLFGRVELHTFELTRPTINLIRREDGSVNWAVNGSRILSAFEPERVGASGLQFGTFQIDDGVLSLTDEARGIEETLTSATLSLTWPRSSTRASLRGSAVWRGEPVVLAASIDQPAALSRPSSTSGVTATLNAAPLRLQFDGTLSPGTDWQATGDIEIEGPSLRRATSWLGADVATGSTFGSFSLQAGANVVGLSADLTDVELAIDGNEADGVLTAEYTNGPETNLSIQGTLDFNQLDLSAYLGLDGSTSSAQLAEDWRFAPLPDLFTTPLSIDLRIAARQVGLAPFRFGETAGSVFLSEDQFVVTLAEAEGYEGFISGTLRFGSVTRTDSVAVSTDIDLAADDVNLRALELADEDSFPVLGRVSATLQLSGTGVNLYEHLQTAAGSIALQVEEGLVNGIDIDAVASDVLDGSLDLSGLEEGGTTDLESAIAEFSLANGWLSITRFNVETELTSISMDGRSHLPAETLSLFGEAVLGPQESEDSLPLPFTIEGTLRAPVFVPDFRRLEERLAEGEATGN